MNTKEQKIETTISRIFGNRSTSFNLESKNRNILTINAIVERLQNRSGAQSFKKNVSTIVSREFSDRREFVRKNSRKRKQELCVKEDAMSKENWDWMRLEPKMLRENKSDEKEKAENFIVQHEAEACEVSSLDEHLLAGSSLDIYFDDCDNWPNVQSIVKTKTKEIEDDKNSKISLSCSTSSSKIFSINENDWMNIENFSEDESQNSQKIEQSDANDLGNKDNGVVETKKISALKTNTIERRKKRKVHQTYVQENSETEFPNRTGWYCCRICDKKYRYKFSLRDHEKRGHDYRNEEIEKSPILTCKQCTKNYRSLGAFINHTKIHMRDDQQ